MSEMRNITLFDKRLETRLDHALHYAEMGFKVIPLRERLMKTVAPLTEATDDPEKIKAWFSEYGDGLGIAVATGTRYKNGYLGAIEVEKPDAYINVMAYQEEYDNILEGEPPVITDVNGRKEYRLVISDKAETSMHGILEGINYLGTGDFIVLPPTDINDYEQGIGATHYEWDSSINGDMPLPDPKKLTRSGVELVRATHDMPPVKNVEPLDIISAVDLAEMEFPPVEFIVDGLLTEGAVLFSGKAKSGKSWLMLQMAISIAKGSAFLGKNTSKGSVLYLALEDAPRRIQERIRMQLDGKQQPANLYITTKAKKTNDGLFDQLREFVFTHKNVKLIIVDVMGLILPPQPKSLNEYQFKYPILSALHDFALRYHLAIILMHHNRKTNQYQSANSDPFESQLGSVANVGAVDTQWILTSGKTTKEPATLSARGRDIEEQHLKISMDRTCNWLSLGDVEQYEASLQYNQYKNNAAVIYIKEMLRQGNGKYRCTVKGLRQDVQKNKGELVGTNEKEFGNIIRRFEDSFTSDGIEFVDEGKKRDGRTYTFRYTESEEEF